MEPSCFTEAPSASNKSENLVRAGRYQRPGTKYTRVWLTQLFTQSGVHLMYRRFAPSHEPNLFSSLVKEHPFAPDSPPSGGLEGHRKGRDEG
jgi:hypothetical protein